MDLARLLLSIGQMPSAGNVTLKEFLEDIYLPWAKSHVRRSTYTGYKSKIDGHITPKLGAIRLNQIEPYTLDKWRDELTTKVSGQTALHIYRALSAALTKAVKWRMIPSNPLHAVEPPKPEGRDLDTLTAEEARAYLAAFKGHALEAAVTIAIAAGLRPSEIYGLEWRDIDTKTGEVTVRRGLHQRKQEIWTEQPKSKRSRRTVSLPEWATAALRPLSGIGPIYGSNPSPVAISRAYRRFVASQEQLRYIPLRDMRHTHATLMLEAGVDIVTVSRRLGHSTVTITDAHYLRPKRSADRNAAEQFESLLRDTPTPGVKSV